MVDAREQVVYHLQGVGINMNIPIPINIPIRQ
jgi:hypothetical protein